MEERPRVAVFAPSPLVTVTVEPPQDRPEIHFHAGGQGVWVARMAGVLGAEVHLATVLGGESGQLLSVLLAAPGVQVHAAASHRPNAAYVHDRRGGGRATVAAVPAPPLRRHELDDLFGLALTQGLACGVLCLTGPENPQVLDAEVYRRLAIDLRSQGVVVIADVTGSALDAALLAGVDVLKLNTEELVAGGWAPDEHAASLYAALAHLHARGAATVIASRGADPAIVLFDGRLFELRAPELVAADARGSGDSMVAGLAVAIAAGASLQEALRLGAAAGALNATRHGLGTGTREQIEQIARAVRLAPIDVTSPA